MDDSELLFINTDIRYAANWVAELTDKRSSILEKLNAVEDALLHARKELEALYDIRTYPNMPAHLQEKWTRYIKERIANNKPISALLAYKFGG